MDYFFGIGSSNTNSQPHDATPTIEKLSDRVRDATLLEDRRSAVQGLRGLARDWQLQVGSKGLDSLVKVLKNDRMDVEIIKLTLETLGILCTNNSNDTENLGSVLTEMFVKDSGNVTLLLDILAEVDFYVRFNCIQLLNTLYTNVGNALHEGILTSPLGISRLIDLLDDRREIIRNDGLLLLIALTANNADIQKIVAFENAFERLFSIIIEEGSIDGGIIVQDCLQLMHNLLRYNASNQTLFRETSCIKQVPKLLVSRKEITRKGLIEIPISDPQTEWSEQKDANTLYVLELIRILVTGHNQNTTINQNLLGQASLVSALFQTAIEVKVPMKIRSQAFLAVGDLISANEVNRDRFGKCAVNMNNEQGASGLPSQQLPPGTPSDCKLALMEIILSKNSYNLRSSAMYAFRCFMDDNIESQESIAIALNPNTAGKLGQLLLDSCCLDLDIARKDPIRVWFASNMILHALLNNAHAKDVALGAVFAEHEESISLLHKVCYALQCSQRDGFDVRVSIGLLSLLSVWMFENVKAVKEFLSDGSNMQFLIEQINQSSGIDPIVQGMSCFLYGIIHEFNDNSEPVFSQTNLENLVQSRIGVDIFTSRIQRLKESKAFNHADSATLDENEIIFDSSFLEFIKTHLDFLVKLVVSPRLKASTPKPKIESPKAEEVELKARIVALEKLLNSKDQEIQTLTSQLQQVQLENSSGLNASDREVAFKELEHICAEQQEKITGMETDQEDLFLCLADQEIEIQELKEKLKGYGEIFEEDD